MSRAPNVSLNSSHIGNIWDTEYCNPREAFSIFRDGICSTFMPWSPEYKSDDPFEGRLEGIAIENGSIGRAQMSPIICTRTKNDIANSPVDGFYANFIISGELLVEQRGHANVAGPGDLVVYDTSSPVTLTERADGRYEDIAILVPKSRFNLLKNAEDHFQNVLFRRESLFEPLAACLSCVERNVPSLTAEEWRAFLDAFTSLLPLATGHSGAHQISIGRASTTLARMRALLDANLPMRELSPSWTADQLGVSCRYVHQLFAASGTTFGNYVRGRRLDKVRADLLSSTGRKQPIHVIAHRWGFGDLSGFNRAFKKRFGSSPREFQV